jgi:hypothetical protein
MIGEAMLPLSQQSGIDTQHRFALLQWSKNLLRTPAQLPWHWSLLVIGISALLPYLSALAIPFTAEDFELILLSNYTFEQLWNEAVLNRPRLRPGAYFQWWASARLFRADPFGYRLVSLAMHTVTVLAVVWFGWLVSQSRRIAVSAGLLFAFYPRHHEPVIWMAANNTTQAAMLAMLGICCFIMYWRSRRAGWMLASLLSLAVGMFANELAVVAVGLVGLIDLFLLRRTSLRTSLRDPRLYLMQLPYVLLIGCYGVLTFWGERAIKLSHSTSTAVADAGLMGESYHLLLPTTTTAKDLAAYITYALLPHVPLRALDPGIGSMILAALCCAALGALIVWGDRLVRCMVVWLIVSILPFLLFVPFGNADRYFYLAAIGVSMIVAAIAVRAYQQLTRRIGHRITRLVGSAVLAAYIVASTIQIQERVGEWRGAGEQIEALTTQVVQLAPDLGPYDPVLFVGLPQRNGQAFVLLGGGISGALAVAYGEREFYTAYESNSAELHHYLLHAEPVRNPQQRVRIFLVEDGRVTDKTAVVGDLRVLNPEALLFRVYETGRDVLR